MSYSLNMARGKNNLETNAALRQVKEPTRANLMDLLGRKITPKDLIMFSHLGPHRRYLGTMQQHFEGFDYNMNVEGGRVIHLPYQKTNFEDILHYLPSYGQGAYGLYNGGVVEKAYYEKLEAAALEKGICMVNTADENATLMLFEKYYPLIQDLTAKSFIIHSEDDLGKIPSDFIFPLFVKGRIKSNKEAGWDACTVKDLSELKTLVLKTFIQGQAQAKSEEDSPQIIVREIMPLKKAKAKYHDDFPISREYRAYMDEENLLELHYYWDDKDPFDSLTQKESEDALKLLNEAAVRLSGHGGRLKCIDIGQLEDGSWKIIELGDPQHTGIAHMSKPLYIQKLCASLSS